MIGYNPCGRAVEIGRGSYRTKCRFFADSDAEADIVWYPALPDAPALGFPSAITSSEWDVRERDGTYPYRTGVGEVFDAPRRRLKPAEKPAATGHHVCGTREDFEQGAKYNPALPPRLYRADGLPVCCAPGEGILFGAGVPAAAPAGLAYTTPAVEVPAGLLLGGVEEPEPPTVDGGASCPVAGLLTPGVEYLSPEEVWPIPWTGYRWFRSSDTVSGLVRIRVASTNPANPSNGGVYLRGADCGSLVSMGSWVGDTFDLTVSVATAGHLYVVVSAPGSAEPPATGPGFTIRLDLA